MGPVLFQCWKDKCEPVLADIRLQILAQNDVRSYALYCRSYDTCSSHSRCMFMTWPPSQEVEDTVLESQRGRKAAGPDSAQDRFRETSCLWRPQQETLKTSASSKCKVCLWLNPTRTQASSLHETKPKETKDHNTKKYKVYVCQYFAETHMWTCILVSHFGLHRHTTASDPDWDHDWSKWFWFLKCRF